MGDSQTLVDSTDNVWDITKNSTDWTDLFFFSGVTEVLGANSTGVTNMFEMFRSCGQLTSVSLFDTRSVTNMNSMFKSCATLTSVPLFDTGSVTNMGSMFYDCDYLTSVPLFDTSSVTNMSAMFQNCDRLASVPLLDTSSVTNMNYTFYNCLYVESGALALYQQASSQSTPPASHIYPFLNCGSNTVTGQAELAQIPTSWGGTAA